MLCSRGCSTAIPSHSVARLLCRVYPCAKQSVTCRRLCLFDVGVTAAAAHHQILFQTGVVSRSYAKRKSQVLAERRRRCKDFLVSLLIFFMFRPICAFLHFSPRLRGTLAGLLLVGPLAKSKLHDGSLFI